MGSNQSAPRHPSLQCRAMLESVSKAGVGDVLDEKYDKTFLDNYRGRRVGMILHPTSLPGPYGSGEIGKECYRMLDWMESAGMQCWQVLPIVPPDQMYYSPYTGLDANCGNPMLISLEELKNLNLLRDHEFPEAIPGDKADFQKCAEIKEPLLNLAARRLLGDEEFEELRNGMNEFRKAKPWVEDSALFECLRRDEEYAGMVWWDWPEPIRLREEQAMKEAKEKFQNQINEFIALQFLFDKQWKAMKAYANGKGIKIMGDMPIYVGGHSADVWANQSLFELSKTGKPSLVSGVPPDAFSATGQLWGTPLYDWEAHQKEDFNWWAQRLGRALELFDETRIDHFRGFAGYWAVDSEEETAINGVWKKGPGVALFEKLKEKIGDVPIVAEDLGVITPDVHVLREAIGAPGMVVLQFAFGSKPDNTHLTHMHNENSVVYPGTHDNETTVGWYQDSCEQSEREFLQEYLRMNGDDIAWALIRESMKSVSKTCMIMLQDLMRLDNSGRMNSPGTAEGNWDWRVTDYNIWENLAGDAKELRKMARIYNRLPKGWDY
ncbi:hypothetical protein BSKO_03671 [Bryopsis sp. KO-2023]|nr:hypothetical protein BSKO_03671 [Bryopsis sp. KO-2023]